MIVIRKPNGDIFALNTIEGFTFTTTDIGDSDVTFQINDNITGNDVPGTVKTTKKDIYKDTDSFWLVETLNDIQKMGVKVSTTFTPLGGKIVSTTNTVTGSYDNVTYNSIGTVTKQSTYDAETGITTEYELMPDYSYTITTSANGVITYVDRFDGTYTKKIYDSIINTTTTVDYTPEVTTTKTQNESTESYTIYKAYSNGNVYNETYNGYDGTTTAITSTSEYQLTETTSNTSASYSIFKLMVDGTSNMVKYDANTDITYTTNVYQTHTESITDYGATGVVVDVKTTSESTVTKTTQLDGDFTTVILYTNGKESITYDNDTKILTDTSVFGNVTTTKILNDSTGYVSTTVDDGVTKTINITDPVTHATIYEQVTTKTDYKVTTITDPLTGDSSITTSDTINNKTVLTVRTVNQATQTTTTTTTDGNTQTVLVDDVINHILTETISTPSNTTVNKVITDPNTGLISTVNIVTTNAVTTTVTVANYINSSGNKVKSTITTVAKNSSTTTTTETITTDKNTGVITTVTDSGTKIVTSVYNPTTGKTTTSTVKK